MEANLGTLFHVQMQAALTRWAASPQHTQKEQAKDYLNRFKKEKSPRGVNASDNRRELRILNETLTEHVFQHKVDIMFTTCSSACHPAISTYFKPSAGFIDRVGQATIPGTCIALDPFRATVKWLVMSGDYNQLPIMAAKDTNEGLSILGYSLFRPLLTDSDQPPPTLYSRYHISSIQTLLPSPTQTFYNGKLQADESAMQVTPVGKTTRQFFQQFKAGKNLNGCRMAIAVLGKAAMSKQFGDTTSYCNMKEARIIARLTRESACQRRYT